MEKSNPNQRSKERSLFSHLVCGDESIDQEEYEYYKHALDSGLVFRYNRNFKSLLKFWGFIKKNIQDDNIEVPKGMDILDEYVDINLAECNPDWVLEFEVENSSRKWTIFKGYTDFRELEKEVDSELNLVGYQAPDTIA